MNVTSRFICLAVSFLLLALGACGGGGSGDEGGSTPPPSAQTGIGAAALDQDTTITVATSSPSAGLPEAAPAAQNCSVVNGTGTVTNANITNVAVRCVTPTVSGALDPTFGGGTGTVSIEFDGAENIAIQSDGRIVVSGFARNGTRTNYALARVEP